MPRGPSQQSGGRPRQPASGALSQRLPPRLDSGALAASARFLPNGLREHQDPGAETSRRAAFPPFALCVPGDRTAELAQPRPLHPRRRCSSPRTTRVAPPMPRGGRFRSGQHAAPSRECAPGRLHRARLLATSARQNSLEREHRALARYTLAESQARAGVVGREQRAR